MAFTGKTRLSRPKAKKGGDKVMVDEKDLSCPTCGQEMKEVSSEEVNTPIEIVLAALPPETEKSKLIFIQCPLRHGFKVLIPTMSDEKRKKAGKSFREKLS